MRLFSSLLLLLAVPAASAADGCGCLCCCCRLPLLAQVMPMLKQMSERASAHHYRLVGVDKLLLSPPVDNPRNVIDYALYLSNHEVGKPRATAVGG